MCRTLSIPGVFFVAEKCYFYNFSTDFCPGGRLSLNFISLEQMSKCKLTKKQLKIKRQKLLTPYQYQLVELDPNPMSN